MQCGRCSACRIALDEPGGHSAYLPQYKGKVHHHAGLLFSMVPNKERDMRTVFRLFTLPRNDDQTVVVLGVTS